MLELNSLKIPVAITNKREVLYISLIFIHTSLNIFYQILLYNTIKYV